jgi:phage-related protein
LRSTIYFDGKSSANFGLIVEYLPESVHAARRGELIPIPGRNGVIVREDGAFDTYTQQYQVWFRNTMGRDTYQKARDVAEWLLSASGFCRLEDTYEPEHFRLARFVGPLSVETVLRNHGRATLEFDVQPQRYLKSGETPLTFTGSTTSIVTNPTQFEARPLLKFVDTAAQPDPVVQTLTMRENYVILPNGSIINAASINPGYAVSNPVSCEGKANALITGNGYAFLDSNGETRGGGYVRTGGWGNSATQTNYKIPVPDWAATVVVSRAKGRDAQVGLSLQDPRPIPGASAVTINGITIDLDFSEHDTIYLDCDLHDAYYADGSNANKMIYFRSSVVAYPTFPGLSPGENTITPDDGAVLDFKMIPRWWEL